MGERRDVFEFGGFCVDPVRRMLFGADGQPIHLKPKAFNTLLYLVRHPHEVIDKRALLKAVWPNVVVEENSLTQAISQLRHVLGEHPGDHRFILTEPGRGYRFVAPINRVFDGGQRFEAAPLQSDGANRTPENSLAPGSTADKLKQTAILRHYRIRSKVPAAVALAALALLAVGVFIAIGQRDMRSVAVLPFDNLNIDTNNSVVVAALHDDILTQLAKVRGLKVIARASVMHYAGPNRNLREIGEQLGTATALEGTVQHTAGIIRINVRLVDTQTAELLWTESYALEPTVLDDVFAVQAEIVKSIAATLDIRMQQSELARLARQPTRSSKAYEYFLSGKRYAKGSDLLRDLPAAVRQFERAFEEDPDFALALAQLSIENIHMYWTMDHNDARREKAASEVQRALELQPELPEAHLAMAWFHYQGHLDYESALRELAIAEQGLPGDADLLFARSVIYTRMGRLDQALPSWESAVELDPRNPNLLRQFASVLTRLRNYAMAEQYLDRVIEIAPDAVEAKMQKSMIPWLRDGDATAHLQAIKGNPLLRPGEALLSEWFIAIDRREYDLALSALTESDMEVMEDSRFWYKPRTLLYGVTYDLAGQRALAIEQFELARAQLEDVLAQRPEDPRVMFTLAEALAGLEQAEAATRLVLQAIEAMPAVVGASDAAEFRKDGAIRVLARAGAVDAAVEQLDIYLAGPGFWSIEGLLPSPRLDPLRGDPRFTMLVEKYRRQ
jgi:TolB-like protein/DNA-binding winged helix-turn-helix (wHTH) protein/Tfp pilus assembly protein PilF